MITKIYVEGGGDGQPLDTLFRQGWTAFFKAAGLTGRMPRVVRGKERKHTFDLFQTAFESRRNGELPLLLVDSEGPVIDGHTVWQHLKSRDNWDRPEGASENQAFLMVQMMESWFLADRELLREYFGPGFKEGYLKEWPALEQVPKTTVFAALKNSTANSSRAYTKGEVSFELLSKLNPTRVAGACPHAKRLLDHLRSL